MTVKGWEQQPWSEKGMVFRGSGHSRKRLRVMPPGKPLRPAEGETQGEGNLEWTGKRQRLRINCSPKINRKARGYSSFPHPDPLQLPSPQEERPTAISKEPPLKHTWKVDLKGANGRL